MYKVGNSHRPHGGERVFSSTPHAVSVEFLLRVSESIEVVVVVVVSVRCAAAVLIIICKAGNYAVIA